MDTTCRAVLMHDDRTIARIKWKPDAKV